ncbi:MAG: acyl-[ACP]--phospholipid O-acyltransferase [Proteobacteria bacterium]|nr:acyl-[ACP]--phospholipid O-acyltransferase [Pseudomonadota bacterium]
MVSTLMTTRRFAPLFWSQFFSAFNDNFLKNSLVFLILFKLGGAESEALITLAGAVFIFPFFFLSALGGEIADRYDKALIARRLKFVEIGVAGVAVVGFWMHSLPVLFLALFLFGVIAALFGPIKYGILPDHLARAELPSGNALVEGGTFLAILTGTIVGGLAAKGGGDPARFALMMMFFATLCWVFARMIPATGEGAPNLRIDRNILRSTFALMGELRAEPRLWWGGIVVSWFWLVGAVILSLLPPLAKNVLGGAEEVVTAFLAIFSIFIALGSGLASWLAAGRIILVPTLIGAILLGVFALDLGWAVHGLVAESGGRGIVEVFSSPHGLRIGFDMAGLATAGGLFIVPSFSAVQAWARPDKRARVIAAVNVLNAAFMTVGAISVALLQSFGVSIPVLMLGVGALSLVVAVMIARTMPTNPVRDLLSIFYRAFFHAEVIGLENIAKAGPNAIIAANHVSFLDASLIASLLDREPVYAIDTGIAQRWWVRPFLRFTRALPIDPTKPFATRTLINVVKGGETLVIFPEGRITITNSLMKIYDGAGMIADKCDVMIVPVRIQGLEATPLSRLDSRQIRRRWFPRVRVTILEPVKLAIDPALKGRKRRMAAGAMLYGVMSDLVFRTTPIGRSIFEALLEAAKEQGRWRVAIEDPVRGALTYRQVLVGAALLGRKLMPYAAVGKNIGVMLPGAAGTAVTTLALMSAGRVPAMINFTSGAANVRGAARAAGVDTILTSREFIEKARLTGLIEAIRNDLRIVYLDDIRGTITLFDKLRAFIECSRPLVRRAADDPATILFTSGSEGTPKGVVLTHRNILANAAQAEASIDFNRTDQVFSVLPLFHSFGLTVGLILPLIFGVRVFLYPSPLHYRIVPEMIYATNATILFGTDTFLAGYARSAHPYDFRSLRYVLSGAEPVKETTRRTYLEKFGLRILEGYGVTETAPALALNTPMFNRFGTVGRLLPGMAARLEPVEGVEVGGRLFVRGPNVMLGYLRAENPGVIESPPDGWHDTGDIVTIDDDGFIAIKGRAKRFAKVGGEMISLAAVELLAGELWPEAMSGLTTVPDARKGERLIMVTTKAGASRSDFIAFARAKGASEMMIPAEFIVVDKLPLLGSGKVDNLALAKLVGERAKVAGAA